MGPDELPSRLSSGRVLEIDTLPGIGIIVEYNSSSGIPFEVAFVGKTTQDARKMMADWLTENSRI